MEPIDPTMSPLTRARNTKELLRALDEYEPGLAAKVRAKTSAEALDAVEGAASTAFLPTGLVAEILLPLIETVGKDRAIDLWRFFLVRRYAGTPLLRPIILGAFRLFGLSPASVFRQLPRAWHLLYRNLAIPSVFFPDERRAVIHLRDVHPEVLEEYPDLMLSLQGGLEGVTELAGADGTSTMRIDKDARVVEILITW